MVKSTDKFDFELIGPPNDMIGWVQVISDRGCSKREYATVIGQRRLSETAREAVACTDPVVPLPARDEARAALLKTSLPFDDTARHGLKLKTRSGTLIGTSVIMARLKVCANTPPGEYFATFDIGGAERVARLTVEPFEHILATPSLLAISGAAGQKVSKRVSLLNAGNVPASLAVLGTMVTEEDEQVCLSLQRGLSAANKGAGAFVETFLASLGERKTDQIKVGLKPSRVRLKPGEFRSVDAIFHLPANMRSGRRYRAILGGGIVTLAASITVTGQPDAKPEPKRAKLES